MCVIAKNTIFAPSVATANMVTTIVHLNFLIFMEHIIAAEPFINYHSLDALQEFDRIQQLAVQTKGIVMPNLRHRYVEVLKIKAHDFKSNDPLGEAKKWAEDNLVKTYQSHVGTSEEFTYQISKKAIKKYLHPSATSKSDSLFVHLSVLKVLPRLIDASVEVEIHADYAKVNDERTFHNPINENLLIHRFYGALRLETILYRIKLTVLEYKQSNRKNKPYTFEVIKIELLDESNSSIFDLKVADSNETDLLPIAKLLQNIEKSYDKGKILLDESN